MNTIKEIHIASSIGILASIILMFITSAVIFTTPWKTNLKIVKSKDKRLQIKAEYEMVRGAFWYSFVIFILSLAVSFFS